MCGASGDGSSATALYRNGAYLLTSRKYNPAVDRGFVLACGHTAYPRDTGYKPAGEPLQWWCDRCDSFVPRMPAQERRAQAAARQVQQKLF